MVISSTNPTDLSNAREALLEEAGVSGDKVHAVAFNVADEAACKGAVQEIKRLTGRTPDILVNNAGANHRTSLDQFTLEKFESVLRVNVGGPFVLARECAPGMRERGWGRIVNVGSIMGEIGRAGLHVLCSRDSNLQELS